MEKQYALSLKQPWAALLAHGLKTIEVRRWPTARRGRVLIHAARVPDERPEAWELVPPELHDSTRLLGGVIGVGQLDWVHPLPFAATSSPPTAAATSTTRPGSAPPVLYGFTFSGLRELPFHPCPGWMRLFKMEWDESTTTPADLPQNEIFARRPQLLVSVRNAAEVEAAVAGGADLIDVKEPEAGPLGPADCGVLMEVIAEVAGRRPVSAALGELLDSFWKKPPAVPHLAYAKWGLAGFQQHAPLLWRWQLTHAAQQLAELNPGCRAVAVAYADWQLAAVAGAEEVCAFAVEHRTGAFLIDTWGKDGSTLLDWLSPREIAGFAECCRVAGVPIALAGSLGLAEIRILAPVAPDWFAVRGAVCQGRRRGSTLDEGKVRGLVDLLAELVTDATSGS